MSEKCPKIVRNLSDGAFFAYLVSVSIWQPCPMHARYNLIPTTESLKGPLQILVIHRRQCRCHLLGKTLQPMLLLLCLLQHVGECLVKHMSQHTITSGHF